MDVEKVLCSESFLVFGQFMMVSCKNHPLQHFSTFHRQVFSAKCIIDSVPYKDAYALAFTIECVCFSLFWSQKVHFKAKIIGFITFLLINFLVRTLQCEETKLKNKIGHVNMNNSSPKVEYLIAEFSVCTIQSGLSSQKQKVTRSILVL